MPLSLVSTLQDVLSQFVILDPGYPLGDAAVTADLASIKIIWPDTSRVRIDLCAMSVRRQGITMVIPSYVQIPGGQNANNPTPAPVLSSLSPSTIAHGGGGFTLTINGTGFVTGSQVSFGAAFGAATFVNSTQLTFNVGAAGYVNAGVVQVSVQAPGGAASNKLPFTVT